MDEQHRRAFRSGLRCRVSDVDAASLQLLVLQDFLFPAMASAMTFPRWLSGNGFPAMAESRRVEFWPAGIASASVM
jgi:hypothetical protein